MATGTNGIATWDELLRYKYPNGITPTSDVLSMCTNDGVDAISNANEIVLGFAVSDSAGSVNDSIGPSTYNTQYVTLSVTGHTYADNQGVRYSDILPSRPIYLKMDFTQASTGYWSYTWQYVYADGTVAAIADLGNNTRNFGGGVRVSANTSTWVHEHSSYISCYSENDGASQSSSSPTAVTGSVTNRVQTANGATLGIYPTGSTDGTSLIYNYSTAYKNNNISNYPANSTAFITFIPYGTETFFILSSDTTSLPYQGGTFHVIVSANTSWTVTLTPTISVGQASVSVSPTRESGTGNMTFPVTVGENTNSSEIAIEITDGIDAYLEVMVAPYQETEEIYCNITVTYNGENISSDTYVDGSGDMVNIHIDSNTTWSFDDCSDGLSLDPTTGYGSGDILAYVLENPSSSERTLYIGGHWDNDGDEVTMDGWEFYQDGAISTTPAFIGVSGYGSYSFARLVTADTAYQDTWYSGCTTLMNVINNGYNLYESTNGGVNSSASVCKIQFSGFSSFTVNIMSSAESSCDYCVITKTGVTTATYSTTGITSTSSKQTLSAWTTYTFTGLATGSTYTFCVTYRKDGSVNSGKDRGWFYLPYKNGVNNVTYNTTTSYKDPS